ncbi:MAG: hypothetical protein HYS12_04590 [Planctomycetes bacterium]|nr:hypothetical protein [Planctomycetota bacterium]
MVRQRTWLLLVIFFPLQGCETAKPKPSESTDLFDDEELQREVVPSHDLDADRQAMWRTVPSRRSDFEVSPVSAINAAARLFAAVKLEGKTKNEVEQAIGYQPRPRYGYNFPFWPVRNPATVVYRFDCGYFGWQFNLRFDTRRRVEAIERRWIH